ncbi:hypothetical protein FOS14_02685 [Skermania sp. ID1734]|uniref:DMT family transporter n=1 Tax=Skermania sp. ID1734 TaxID=2597516 RepID=UPI00117EF06C|nr:DMT family transporter [Skermania sp. ID1734]TSE01475.1 hypothetical protein FOS14_02685 [Skermania sp. ID1734]
MIATALGLLAAFLFALSAYLEKRAARKAVGRPDSSVLESSGIKELIKKLPRSKTWLTGWFTNMCGFMTHGAALKLGSVAAVQPLMSAQLLFVVTFASIERRHWPRPRDWASAFAVCGGLVLFVITEGAAPLNGSPRIGRILLATACAVALVATFLFLSRHTLVWIASMLVGISAGICHAMTAVFMKLTTEELVNHGIGATATDWPGYALAVSTLSGLLLGQLAFASGALPPAVASISVTNPIMSYAVGLLAFNAPAPTSPGSLAAIAGAGLLIILGITGLAHAPITQLLYAEPEPASTEDEASPHPEPA